MWSKLKIFLSFLLSTFLLFGAIILTIQLNNVVLELKQNIIDLYGFQLGICIILYGCFIVCLVYGLYLSYIEYKRKQVEQRYKDK